MIHLFKSAAARTLTLTLMGLVALGLAIGAVRLALPFADLFRSQLEDTLSEAFGLRVRMSELHIRLAGMVPRVTLQDVSLIDPATGHTQLDLMELRLDLDLTASLLELSPRVESLTLVGAHLVAERRANGTLAVAGLEGIKANDPSSMSFFLANGRFLLTESDVDWIDRVTGAAPLHLTDVRIRFDNAGSRHRVGLRARLANEPASRLHLAADLSDTAEDPGSWAGGLFLDWQGGDLGIPLAGLLPPGLSLVTEALSTQTWVTVTGSAVTGVLARTSVQGLQLRRTDKGESPPLVLPQLEGTLQWQREQGGWRLGLADLSFEHDGTRSPITDAALRLVRGDAGTWTLFGGAEWLRLADLHSALALLPAPPDALATLTRMRPAAEVRGLRLRLAHGASAGPDWAASGRLQGLHLEADGRLPGVQGLDVRFVANAVRGSAELEGEDMVVDLPQLLEQRGPLRLAHLSGRLFWKGDATDIRIEMPSLALENPDIRARTRLALTLPADGEGPFLDLYATFGGTKATAVRRYLPGGILRDHLEHWLERAFVAGRVPEGALLFRGRPRDYPFREHEGRFEALFRVEDAALYLHDDWPLLRIDDGEVHFVDSSLEIEGAGGFYDSLIPRVSARIPDLLDARAVEVRGTVEGPFADLGRLLEETPLNRRLGPIAAIFRPEGRSRLDLDMAVPLRPKNARPPPLALKGQLSWPEPATLAMPNAGLTLTDLSGALSFTEHGLSHSRIEADLWGSPVKIDIETGDSDGGPLTRVAVAGNSTVEALAARFPSSQWDLAGGGTDWTLDLAIPNAALAATEPQPADCKDEEDCREGTPELRNPQSAIRNPKIPLDFSLRSNLRGLSVALPPPLGKTVPQSRDLRLEGRLAPGEDLALRGRYGDLGLSLALVRGDHGGLSLERGALALGQQDPPLPQAAGLHLNGRLATLDLPAWSDWLEQRPAAGATGGGGAEVRSADLRIDRLLLPGVNCTDLHLTLDRKPDGWDAALEAKELAGRLSIPDRARRAPLRVTLQRLDLEALLADGQPGESSAGGSGRGMDPRRAHTLDLTIDQISWGESELGRLTLHTQPVADGVELADLDLDARPLMEVQGSGRWTLSGGGQETAVDLTATGSDLGEFLRRLGYKSLLYQAPATAELHLTWPAGPTGFSLATLAGTASAEVGKGSLLDVDPGVGRMLGVLNLSALQRRLSLDFSDVFDRGYAFEKMTGRVTIGQGQVMIDDLVIEGPSAEIQIAGSTNLVEQRFDQVVTVTPSVGTSLALASAVAGGPLVGAAVLIADRITGGVVNKLASYQYDVTGSWTEPDIRRRGGVGGSGGGPPATSDQGRAGTETPAKEPPPGSVTEERPKDTKDKGTPETAPATPKGRQENLFLPDL